ncbi:MAG: alkaline phosphatase, partial [Meiothermus sp.]
MRKGFLAVCTLALSLSSALAAKIAVYPYDGANVLAGQRFDLRVEASELQGNVSAYTITLDGQPVQSLVQSSAGAGQAEWTLRQTFLRSGEHTLTVSVTDGAGKTERNVKWTARANPRVLRAPKNIILFVGDGMGWNTLNAARIIAKGFNPENGVPR